MTGHRDRERDLAFLRALRRGQIVKGTVTSLGKDPDVY
jgi:hypothetical protein